MAAGPGIVELLRQGAAHQEAGRLDEAEALYRRVLAIDPARGEGHVRLANLLEGRGRLEEAVASWREAIRLMPDRQAQLHNRLGNTLAALNHLDQALTEYDHALRSNPRSAVAQYNLAHLLNRLGRLEEAAERYRRAIALEPGFAAAHNNLGHVLNRLGRHEEAARCCREALRLRPGDPAAQNNLGNALAGLARFEEAEACYREALRLKPDLPETQRNLGDALSSLRRFEEAVSCYREALRRRPELADAWNNLGVALGTLGDAEEAARCYDEALRRKPDFLGARLNRGMAQLRIVYRDEAEIERARAAYAAELEAACRLDAIPTLTEDALATAVKPPFLLAYQGLCNRELQARYGRFVAAAMAKLHPAWASPPEVTAPASGAPIRVGILSAYFYGHSNWKIPIKGWLAGLDRRRFRLFGYHLGYRQDAETELARRLCHRFVQGLPTLEGWAERIRADRLHVLLIPGIGMDDMTIRLAALRLAPRQATSWGHPDTTGLPTIDDYLSSALMEPADGDEHYTERLVRLPNLSISYEPAALTPEPVTRAEIGVADEAVLYWCCQSLYKYLPRHDQVFASIAAAVPEARFVFIKYPHGEGVTALFRERLAAAFARIGRDAAQHCVFLPPMSTARFAGISRLADVFLDSLGWSGCNSTLEALAWDLPVVTMAGDLMRGRHSAAILTMLGMPELIAADAAAYVALAAQLGRDREWRRALARRIAQEKQRLYRDAVSIKGLADYLEEAAARIHQSDKGTPSG
jgi:protein O-GlcNAc transferase